MRAVAARGDDLSEAPTRRPGRKVSLLAGLAATLVGFLVVEPSPVWAPDYGSYLAMSRSLLPDQDILFIDDLPLVGAPVRLTPMGFAVDHHHIGSVLLRLPFHAVGHMVAVLGNRGGGSVARQRVEPPDVLWLKLGDWTYGSLLQKALTVLPDHAEARGLLKELEGQ